MNNRTITHNQQLDQIIGALQPKAEKPAPLSATWPVLHERAMETAKLANANPWPNEPQNDCVFAVYMAVVLLICIIIYQYLGGKK